MNDKPQISTNDLVLDYVVISQDLGQRHQSDPSLVRQTHEQLQQSYYKRLDEALDGFTNGLRELQTKAPTIEAEINLLKGNVTKLENKKFAEKEDLATAEKRLEKQIDEIKSNKKFWFGLFMGAILTIGVQIIVPFAKQQLGIIEQPKNPPQLPNSKSTK